MFRLYNTGSNLNSSSTSTMIIGENLTGISANNNAPVHSSVIANPVPLNGNALLIICITHVLIESELSC